MSNLTSEQVDAITYAYLDISAADDLLNGGVPIDSMHHTIVGFACKQSKTDLEEAFPFLLEGVEDE
jgi:hypothetical protein